MLGMRIPACIGAAAVLLSLAAPAHALRCEHRVIVEGDPSAKLLRYCGEPHSVRTREARRMLFGNLGNTLFPGFSEEVLIEEWTYNFGPNRLMRLIRIENGVVTDIRHLGYGFLPST